jgi:hypothetical protein
MHPRFPMNFGQVKEVIPCGSPVFRNMKMTMNFFLQTVKLDASFCAKVKGWSRKLNSGQKSIIQCDYGHWILDAIQDNKFSADLMSQELFEKKYFKAWFMAKTDIYAMERRKCFLGALCHVSLTSTYFRRDYDILRQKCAKNMTSSDFLEAWTNDITKMQCRPSTYKVGAGYSGKVSVNPAVPPFLNITFALLSAVGVHMGGMSLLANYFATTIYVTDQTPNFKHIIRHK